MKHLRLFEDFDEEVDYAEKLKELVNIKPEIMDIKIAGQVALMDGDVEGYVVQVYMIDGELNVIYHIDIDGSGVPSEEHMPVDYMLEDDAQVLYEYLIKQ